MQDFAKKLISTAMALVLTASMSVYAEEVVPVESENSGVLAVIAENTVNGTVSCANHVTFRNDERVYMTVNGSCNTVKACSTMTDYYGYNLICMKCHEMVSLVKTKMVVTHSVTHS